MVMWVKLQAQGPWEMLEFGDTNGTKDLSVLVALLRAAPPELVLTLAAKDSINVAWDALKTM
jgi:hypothetical protein